MCPGRRKTRVEDARARPAPLLLRVPLGTTSARARGPPQEPGDRAAGGQERELGASQAPGSPGLAGPPSASGVAPRPPTPELHPGLVLSHRLWLREASGDRWLLVLTVAHALSSRALQAFTRDSPHPTPHSHHSRDINVGRLLPHPFATATAAKGATR